MGLYNLILLFIGVFFIRYILKAIRRAKDEAHRQQTQWTDDSTSYSVPDAPPRKPKNAPPVTSGYVLVADKSQTIRTLIRMLLQPMGFGILEAETGSKAWKIAKKDCPDLVIADTKLSGMNGFQLAERMLSTPDLKNIPLILLTGSDANIESETLKFENVRMTLSKPFGSEEFLKAVAQSTVSREKSPVCPVCDSTIDGQSTTCPKCGATHHKECFDLNFGCGKCDYEL